MGKDELQRLIKLYETNQRAYKNAGLYNEQNCRDEFISPLLECFGWDVHNKKGVPPQYREVVVEKFSNAGERPDYTLTLSGVARFFAEAKKPAVDITSDPAPALQARRYGWNAGHRLSVLTNFENLMIYDTSVRPEETDSAKTALYRLYHYTEYLEKYPEISSLISRESVYSGAFDRLVEESFPAEERYSEKIDRVFLRQLNEWRLEIGRSLYGVSEKYRDMEVLNDVVQEFLNQIIFLRICEDRNLPLYQKLKDTAGSRKELKAALTKVFREMDARYNSKLFAGENIIFDLDNEIIYRMILSLYYPQTPYLFQMIDPGILGKIYESFLAESLTVQNGEPVLAAREEYKYRSVVSTPVEIVKYMVKNTLEPFCRGKSPAEIKTLRIADIACGSGVFLEEAYQFLADCCVQWYTEHDPAHLVEISSGRKKLPLSEKKEILTHCIYGVDIDIHAVEVSRFSLLIKLLEDETQASAAEAVPVLPDLSSNIRCGNSLISPADLGLFRDDFELLRRIKPFEWEDFGGAGFDVILGNPPYVKTEDIHTLESGYEFEIYKEKYQSAYKQFDKYFLFIEKAAALLKSGGRLCYIVPNKFFKIGAGQELRRMLAGHMIQLDDFGDMQLFPDKTIYSSILTAGKSCSEKFIYTKVSSLASLWAGEEQENITLKNSALGADPWRLSADIEFIKMIAEVEENGILLEDAADIFNGIQTSAERPVPVYWFREKEIVSETDRTYVIRRFDHDFQIEKEILKLYFKPAGADEKGMTTYSLLKTDKRILFPYTERGDLIDIDTMKTRYPGAYEYLLSCYDLLVPKCLNGGKGRDIKNADRNTWYQYGRTQAITSFVDTPKLIVRVLSKTPMYAYDKSDMLIASGGTAGYCAIAALPGSGYDLAYIQAWLNHPYTEKLLQIMGSDFEGGFTARGTYLLKKIPLVKLDFSDPRQKAVYDRVVSASYRIYELNDLMEKKRDKTTREVAENEKNRLMRRIEDDITRVYKLQF